MDGFDLIVVGAGPAGLAAAAVVSRFGGRVLVLDESPKPGGRLPGQIHPAFTASLRPKWSSGTKRANELFADASSAGAQFFPGVSVWGLFPEWFIGTTPADPSQRQRNADGWYKAKACLIAAGAAQNALVLPGWALPGVITAGAAQTLINVYRVLPGRSAVVIGIDPLSITTALLMSACGIEVKGILLPPETSTSIPLAPEAVIRSFAQSLSGLSHSCLKMSAKLIERGATILSKLAPTEGIPIAKCRLMINRKAQSISGESDGKTTRFILVDSKGRRVSQVAGTMQSDTVVTSAGLHPLVELCQVAGCPLVRIEQLGGWVPVHSDRMETPVRGLFVAGSITGVEGAKVAEAQGRVAGFSIAKFLQLSSGYKIETDLKHAEDEVLRSRKSSFPFLAQITKGRSRMEGVWDHSLT